VIWSIARALVYLKRLAESSARMALAEEELARISRTEFSLAHPTRRPIRAAEFGVADIDEDWNKRYRTESGKESAD